MRKVASRYDTLTHELTIVVNGVSETWTAIRMQYLSVVELTPRGEGPTLVCVRGAKATNHCNCGELRAGWCRHLRACRKEKLL